MSPICELLSIQKYSLPSPVLVNCSGIFDKGEGILGFLIETSKLRLETKTAVIASLLTAHGGTTFGTAHLNAWDTALVWCPLATAWADTLATRSPTKTPLLATSTSAALACTPTSTISSGSLSTASLHHYPPD